MLGWDEKEKVRIPSRLRRTRCLLTRSAGPPSLGVPNIAHAACWAHARRHLYDEFEKTKSPIAAEALRRIGQLYEIEAEITGMTAEQRLAARQKHAVPIVAALKLWFEVQQRRLSSKNSKRYERPRG